MQVGGVVVWIMGFLRGYYGRVRAVLEIIEVVLYMDMGRERADMGGHG